MAQHVANRLILCKSSGALPRSEQSCVWSWLSRVCDGDLGGEQKSSSFFVVETMAIFTQTRIPQEETAAREYWGGLGEIFFVVGKSSRMSFRGFHTLVAMVLISSGEPDSSYIYSSACGAAGADFDLFTVCDTWEVVPGSEWRLSKDFESQTSLLDVFTTLHCNKTEIEKNV